MKTLHKLISTYFPYEQVKKQAQIEFRDRWVLFGKLGLPATWYPLPVEMVETDSYMFFDVREANSRKAIISSAVAAVIIAILTNIFFGYFSIVFVFFGLVMGLIVLGLLYLIGTSLEFGILAIPKDWIESVFEKNGWVVVWGRKDYGDCKSMLCRFSQEQLSTVGIKDELIHKIGFDQVYELFGTHERFQLKYRAARGGGRVAAQAQNQQQVQAGKSVVDPSQGTSSQSSPTRVQGSTEWPTQGQSGASM